MRIFTLQITDLTNLSQDRAVDFFRRLLWAEAARIGIGRSLIDVPQCINVGDGGIDAFIKDAKSSIEELILNGTSGFQIKSSDLPPSDCKKELHQEEGINKPIKPEVKKLLDSGGVYILVLFADITKIQRTRREEAIREELIRCGYTNPRFYLYTASQLIGFAERFPSVVTWFKNELSQCLPFSSWSNNHDVRSPKQFIFDESRQKLIEEIRKSLRDPDNQCLIFRVTGLPGIGKTRFVFETLSSEDFKHRVIYVKADQFLSSTLYNTLQNDTNLSAIVVIDECDLRQHDRIMNSFSDRGSRLAIFTLSYDIGKIPPPSIQCKLDPLGKEEIKKILKAENPKLPEDFTNRLVEFADGYPRIAVLLGESYLKNGGSLDDFLTISNDVLMNRLIGGSSDTTSDHFKTTKKVLSGISLFKKIGYKGDLSKESEWLAKEIINVDFGVFKEVVGEQRKRGIIQGQNYIYVTPFMLRIHLLREWWETYGLTVKDFDKFIKKIPEEFRADLLQRFFDHLPYINTTEQGREFAKVILSEKGVFSSSSIFKTRTGANFFLKMTEADPKSALECLKRTIGTCSKKELLEFTSGRREVVWSLERIAVWRDLFIDAAKLLLILGEAENETWSNNASGVFTGLFSTGYGDVAPTEASPQERFLILKEVLKSSSKEQRALALRACNQALESRYFARAIGVEQQGLRKKPQLWMPKTYGELFDAYRQVWQLLRERLDNMPEDEQQQAVDILLHRARGLGSIQNLADMVIDTVNELAQKPYVDKKKVLAEVLLILHYDSKELPTETRQRWEQLRDELTGHNFSSLMKRYVGMDLLQDKFDENGRHVDQTQPRIEELAQQAIENEDLLRPELDWLITTVAQNGYRFGYELGKKDRNFSLLTTIIGAQENAIEKSTNFIGGYFHALFERDKGKWENQLDALIHNEKLNTLIPELTWRSGMSDKAALRILDLAEKGIIGINHFRVFGLGSFINDLSEDVFKRWIEFFLKSSEISAISIALDLYHFYYISKDSKRILPEELTLKLLNHQLLFQKPNTGNRGQMDNYNWTEVGKVFIQHYPKASLVLAASIFEHFGEDGTIVEGFHPETQAVINEITERFPNEIWEYVIKYLGPPVDSRAFHIGRWLRGGEFFETKAKNGALTMIPIKKIWEWVDKDIENRAWYLATFVPQVLFREEGKICLAREVLIRYGSREDVKNNLMANFSSEGWSGPASLHYQGKKRWLLDFRKGEDNDNVKRCIDEYVSSLDQRIEIAKIQEERDDWQ